MSGWYPVMLNLKGRLCVVVGGGEVAERKAGGVLQAGARVRVFSLAASPLMKEWAEAGVVEFVEREAEAADLDGASLAFAATDDPEANLRVAEWARERGIPANVADDGERGDFLVPAFFRRGGLVVSASTSGAGPSLSSRLVRELERKYGDRYGRYADALGEVRATVKERVKDAAERRRLLLAAASSEEALEEWANADWLQDAEKLLGRLRSRAQDGKG